jgi:hypothetical protein
MYRKVDWLRPADRPILSEIANLDGRWIKPASLSLNVSYSRYTVADRCRQLGAHGLVDVHDDVAAYRINDRGLAFLDGELQPRDIE